MAEATRILVVDDEPAVQQALGRALVLDATVKPPAQPAPRAQPA